MGQQCTVHTLPGGSRRAPRRQSRTGGPVRWWPPGDPAHRGGDRTDPCDVENDTEPCDVENDTESCDVVT